MIDRSKWEALMGVVGRTAGGRPVRQALEMLAGELLNHLATIGLAVTTTLYNTVHGNKNILMSGAGGARTFTLPAATGSKTKYRFTVAEVNTSNYVVKVANSSDTIDGQISSLADGGDTLVGWETAATSDTITLNGTTTGGVAIGDWFELQDIATNQWTVTGIVTSSGVEATPFSATV